VSSPAAGSRPAVDVTGVSHGFAGKSALEDVTVRIEPGEIFGFLGPDGAGKTTLFRILTTLIAADAGEARVLGLDVKRDLWALRKRLGYMPGRFSLYPDLTVAENLEFFATAFGTRVEDQYDVIAPIYRHIEPFKDRPAGALSGGMKQKLALSCALVHRPEILILDEPTTGVDAVSRREFWDLLDDLRAGGLTIVVSTPYMDEADRCDRVALIQRGRLLAVDRPGEMVRTFPLPVVEVRGPDRYGLLLGLRKSPHAHSVFPFGESLHFVDRREGIEAGAAAADLAAFAEASGLPLTSAEAGEAGIEDLFIFLMGDVEAVSA
jgi:ABC-2 type transport system ATP-binding protein